MKTGRVKTGTRLQVGAYAIMLLAGLAGIPGANPADPLQSKYFGGCTPCNTEIKAFLGIPEQAACDMIRWKLTLRYESRLPVSYQAVNEWGFFINNQTYEKGGIVVTEGKSMMLANEGNPHTPVISMQDARKTRVTLLLKEINGNLLHFTDSHKGLLASHGGWSYTLNNLNPEPDTEFRLTSLVQPEVFTGSGDSLIYVGRTPCAGLRHHLKVPEQTPCSKLKWKLVLYLDPITGKPANYSLERTFRRQSVITGLWAMRKATRHQQEVTLYLLDPDKPESSLTLLKGDDNVLFFLDRHHRLLTGDEDFSYTLNLLLTSR